MKNIYLTFWTLLIIIANPLNLFSQCDIDFGEISNDYRYHEMSNRGNLLSFENAEQNAYYENKEAIFDLGFAKGLWVSGLDPVDNLKVCAATYNNNSRYDYVPGPLSGATSYSYYAKEYCYLFDTVWVFSQLEIENHKTKFKNNTLQESDIPFSIFSYPARLNPYYEFVTPFPLDLDLAPFFDQNQDGKYNPMDGDHPIPISENPSFIPHQFSYSVFSDFTAHSFSQAATLNFEFQQINYIMNCGSDIDKSVFTRIIYTNKGLEDLRKGRICIFEDIDLGNPNDDFFGCDTLLNCNYVYNSDEDVDQKDESYPITGTLFLNKQMRSFINLWTGGGISFLPGTFHNQINGKLPLGESLTVGGNGQTNSGPITNFIYHDRPGSGGWTQYDGDQTEGRTLTSFDLGLMTPGQTGHLDYVDYVIYQEGANHLELFDQLDLNMTTLNRVYDNILNEGGSDCDIVLNASEPEENLEINVYPNPANNFTKIDLAKMTSGSLELYNIIGQKVKAIEFSNTESIALNLNGISSGLHLLSIKNDQNHIIANAKLVVD